jgi:CheY-like chemotaxis protein
VTESSNWLVLVVEDEPDGLHVVTKLLETYNIAAHGVSTAEEALALLQENHYNGAIIDLALPGIDGWGLLERIHSNAQTAALPCVAITAYHSSSVRQQAQQSGFVEYFPKPLNDRTFVAEFVSVIDSGG